MTQNLERIEELLGLSKENLAKKQHEVLEAFAMDILRDVAVAIQKQDYERAKTHITKVKDVGILNFNYQSDSKKPLSILEVVEQLSALHDEFNGGTDDIQDDIKDEDESDDKTEEGVADEA